MDIMGRKLFFLVSAVLAMSLLLTSTAKAEIVSWWKLDEGSGTTALDSSGNGNNATFQGGPMWADNGKFGKAVRFNGTSDYLAAPDSDSLDIKGDQLSIAAWVNRDVSGGTRHVVRKVADSGTGAIYMIRIQSETVRAILNTGGADITVQGVTAPAINEWIHVALVYDGTEARIYVNGKLDVAMSVTGAVTESNNELRIGRGEPAGYLQGMIDDVRLYNHALTESELASAMEGTGAKYPYARSPSPADGTLHPDTWVNLSWSPGDFAASHNVYLGDNFDDVNNGAGATFQGNQLTTSLLVGLPGYPFPDGLIPGMTYYWRIDEVNDAEPNSPWKGPIWSFSIPPKTAYNPVPADGAEFVALDAKLTWTAGFGAKLHTVYLGDDFDVVSNATGGLLQGTTTYTPSALQAEKVYYWRVDEFDGTSTYKGDIWAFTTPGAAGNPQPANGTADVQMTAKLSWTPATNATSHNVYFGMDQEAVKNATTASPEYKGSKAKGSETYDPDKMAWNSSYYWRVDAVYSTGTIKGLVWTFTTADFISVDDFESYNDIDPPDPASNRIFDKWIDGFAAPTTNGALVGNDLPPYAEQTIVHGGAQSMPYRYDNANKTSEATLTLVYPRDWTEEGVTKLSLWYRGASTNSAERMYVSLNGGTPVYNADPKAAQATGWTEWVIDLSTFQGVTLTNVNTITLGFGTKGSPAAGGPGKVYFDDIRLYRP
jgi:hypothetical protein